MLDCDIDLAARVSPLAGAHESVALHSTSLSRGEVETPGRIQGTFTCVEGSAINPHDLDGGQEVLAFFWHQSRYSLSVENRFLLQHYM
jgi:hypothetical protein